MPPPQAVLLGREATKSLEPAQGEQRGAQPPPTSNADRAYLASRQPGGGRSVSEGAYWLFNSAL